jgi:hypothetical protein
MQSRCKHMSNEPIAAYCHSWPQRQCVRLKWDTKRARRNSEPAMEGRCAMGPVVLMQLAE